MGYKCVVPKCRGNYKKDGLKVSTFKFPVNEELRRKWIAAVPRDFTVTKYSRVCELHFAEKDIRRSSGVSSAALLQPRLNPGTVPTVFEGCPRYLSKSLVAREAPETKKRRIENSQLESIIKDSIQTHELHVNKHKVDSLDELCKKLSLVEVPNGFSHISSNGNNYDWALDNSDWTLDDSNLTLHNSDSHLNVKLKPASFQSVRMMTFYIMQTTFLFNIMIEEGLNILLMINARASTSRDSDDSDSAAATTAPIRLKYYNMNYAQRGMCLIFNHKSRFASHCIIFSGNHPMVLYEQESKVGAFRCRKKHQTGKDEKNSRADDYTYNQAIRETSCLISKTLREIVADWYSYGREIVVAHLLDRQDAAGSIGGLGKIVEIDKLKFGKRKYNAGRVVEGSWVLGMYERYSNELRLEVLPSDIGGRSTATLIPLMLKHVAAGSIINTECWATYAPLGQMGVYGNHQIVNHSQNFVDMITGANTQTIESNWRPLKHHLRQSGQPREKLADRLLEFLWRRELRLKREDPFNAFLEILDVLQNGHNCSVSVLQKNVLQGSSEIVGVGFLALEDKSSLCSLASSFKEKNDSWPKTRIVLTDKDSTERLIFKDLFPHSDLEICLFHTMRTFKREEWTYMACFNGNFLHMTNNRLECINGKIKSVVSKFSSFDSFIAWFFSYIRSMRSERDHEASKSILKLDKSRNTKVTHENDLVNFSYSYLEKEYALSPVSCQCLWSMRMPCQHILFDRRKQGIKVFDPEQCDQRWIRSNYMAVHMAFADHNTEQPHFDISTKVSVPKTFTERYKRLMPLVQKIADVASGFTGADFMEKEETLGKFFDLLFHVSWYPRACNRKRSQLL
ncbi:hypothetical protein JTE90_000002 [Oedothorax gibbosus]|uniref:THAP-type domain-containing protein n=1 Tax=Oedothorax gibbosus TaxID=931172 RepID=A0AAV6TWI1_9ARAC|nr:hypothetical protein JTE90_000002 [Oedothorax gibbosus]